MSADGPFYDCPIAEHLWAAIIESRVHDRITGPPYIETAALRKEYDTHVENCTDCCRDRKGLPF